MVITNDFPREQMEHRVFQALLQAVPGLDAQLLHGSEDAIRHIAELVCIHSTKFDDILILKALRSRKVFPVQGLMTQKVLKAASLTGSHCVASS